MGGGGGSENAPTAGTAPINSGSDPDAGAEHDGCSASAGAGGVDTGGQGGARNDCEAGGAGGAAGEPASAGSGGDVK
jgi:hypothetical protein